MKPKAFIFIVLISAIVPSIVLLSINIVVDPYNEFGYRNIARLPLVETVRLEKIRLIESKHTKSISLILGSSRMMEISPSVFGDRGFNYSVNSAMPEDFLAQIRWLDNKGIKIDRIVIGVDFNMFNGSIPVDPRLISARQLFAFVRNEPAIQRLAKLGRNDHIISDFWRKYLSRRMLDDSIAAIRANILGFSEVTDTLANGMLLRKRDLETRAAYGWKIDEGIDLTAYMDEKFSNYVHLSNERFELFQKSADLLEKMGASVWLVLTPYHPIVLEKIYSDKQLSERFTELKNALFEMAKKDKWTFVDATELKSIRCSKDEMWDIVHLMPECSVKLVETIMSGD
ncbi:MAG: DUF1574 family protein [Gammaproteobacteria bacterium]|nr:DUF1574 family protein [Gammaproteobacteria bacterium]